MAAELILGVATVLGGVVAIWYFWDKIREWVWPAPGAKEETAAEPLEEKWVDLEYPASLGLGAQWQAQGYEVRWCSETNLSRRIHLEGLEVARVQERDGRHVMLRLRDRPENQTLIRKKIT